MTNAVSSLAAFGRLLIAVIFVRAGINKLGSIAATSATMAGHGIPYPDILVWGAVVVELGGGLFLVFGVFTRWAALALFFYTLALALIFHAYWTATGAAVRTESASFYGHLAMMGGMLYITAFGAGRYSLDALFGLWRPAVAEPYSGARELHYDRSGRPPETTAQRGCVIAQHTASMSALGHKRTFRSAIAMSALPPKADIQFKS